jgi:hypothetical protein
VVVGDDGSVILEGYFRDGYAVPAPGTRP